jgi:hypothetical protein
MINRLIIILTIVWATGVIASEPIDIGTRRELFVDEYLIEHMQGARLQLHHPVPRDVAVVHDTDWEGNTCGYHTVFQDGDLYRMYYRGSHHGTDTERGEHPQFTCYAESRDGIHWVKPELELYEFAGSTANNIVWAGSGTHNFAPFKDANPNCAPESRYKALGGIQGGLATFASADGIHWRQTSEGPVITEGAFDSQNLAFWDTQTGCYREFHRHFTQGVRAIMTCTSDDCAHWTAPVWLEYTEAAPNEHLYTNQITQYPRAPQIYMGFPKRFLPTRRAAGNTMPGLSDGVFMTSRDGLVFHRWLEAWIRPGPQRQRWVNRNNMTAWGIVETQAEIPGTPDELSVYSTEGYYQGEFCQIRRYSLRMDGFVSVSAPMIGGEIITKPLVFAAPQAPRREPDGVAGANTKTQEGRLRVTEPMALPIPPTDRLPSDGQSDAKRTVPRSVAWGDAMLLLNVATSAAGSVRCELQAADGTPIPGFTLEQCDTIFGDEIERIVSWGSGRSELKQFAGRPIRLRIELQDADIYALRFGQPSDASGERSQ